MRRSPRIMNKAAELAGMLSSDQGAQIFRLIKHLSLCEDASSADVREPGSQSIPGQRRVGIWEPVLDKGRRWYVRPPMPVEAASLWANIGRIPPKGPHRRIVLLGESVARGFFFDPAFNPAVALQSMLRRATSDHEVEVIDLARTSLSMDQLCKTAAQAVDLCPDAMVILAGNNWSSILSLNSLELIEAGAILRSGANWAEVMKYFEGILRDRTLSLMQFLCGLALDHNFVPIFVIPEFNLVDWRSDVSEPPLLTSAATFQWESYRAEAERALLLGELQRADNLALRMLELDHGTTPVPFNIMGEVRLRSNSPEESRGYFEKARDAAMFWPRTDTPRCPAVVQETIRNNAAGQNILIVDLPRVFREHWNCELPDHRMFLDYCHFTFEATHVAMAAVAEVVLSKLFKITLAIPEISRFKVTVANSILGEAHFLAAIHNANWGQSAEIVTYHCGKAIELSPEIARMMALYLDFHVRRSPMALCKSFDEMAQSCSLSAVSLLFNPSRPVEETFVNLPLVFEIAKILEKIIPSQKQDSLSRLVEQHGVEERCVDLLGRAYSISSNSISLDYFDYAYYKGCERASRFKLICKSKLVVRLMITYRCRQRASDEPIIVRIDGVDIADLPASTVWHKCTILVPAERIQRGVNLIEIQWPAVDWNVSVWRDDIAEHFERGELIGIAPVFGEIYELSAASV
jgi:hypothetical protein